MDRIEFLYLKAVRLQAESHHNAIMDRARVQALIQPESESRAQPAVQSLIQFLPEPITPPL